MKGNLKPGPKPRRKRAIDGTLCPPASEGHRVWRGNRWWKPVCKKAGHPKPHPGRCVICRRASDKKRDAKPERKAAKYAARLRWSAKPGSKEKTAAWAHRRNQREEQKVKNAVRMREVRDRQALQDAAEAKKQPARLLPQVSHLVKLAEAKATQAQYGITRVGYAR